MRSLIRQVFGDDRQVPEKYRSIFRHLYWDVAYYGILNGTTITFLSIYTTRLGATNEQIGLLSAAPGVVAMLLSIPAANWLSGKRLGRTVFWLSTANRIFYLFLAILPLIFSPATQIWTIILATFLMTIPAAGMGVAFNSMMMELVPQEYRGRVVGIRNALLSITTLVFTLISGWVLVSVPFKTGYFLVFGFGFVGAALSGYHLFRLRNETGRVTSAEEVQRTGARSLFVGIARLGRRFIHLIGLMLTFHLAQWLVIPVVPIFSVKSLGLSDAQISLGNALFSLLVFLGSLQLARVTSKIGNQRATGIGILGMALFPVILSFAQGPSLYIVAHIVGGVAWALAGGALYNYLLEHIPPENKALGLSIYLVLANAAVLIGSLTGPAIAGVIGTSSALLLFGVFRFLSGLAILRFG